MKKPKFMTPYKSTELPATSEKRLRRLGGSLYVLIPHRWLLMHDVPSHLILTMTKDQVVVTPKHNSPTKPE